MQSHCGLAMHNVNMRAWVVGVACLLVTTQVTVERGALTDVELARYLPIEDVITYVVFGCMVMGVVMSMYACMGSQCGPQSATIHATPLSPLCFGGAS